jgi:protein N-terminal methyltransferase
VEPVLAFIQEGLARARAIELDPTTASWPGLSDQSKSVTFLQNTLQLFQPLLPHHSVFHDRIGHQPQRPTDDIGKGFDVIWCQWCLGYLANPDLVAFLERCRGALNENPRSLVVVKENICCDAKDGSAQELFDQQDSSLTRFVTILLSKP